MDTVASGLEASPWGFNAYGYAPFVQNSPGNTVAALASYWLNHVRTAMAWEERHPELCHRVRYEDLVTQPAETVRALQGFLEVQEHLSVLTDAFRRKMPRGPGDYKVVHTSGVNRTSIGHGKRVPVSMLPPMLLDAINEQLPKLGYEELTPSWNLEERTATSQGPLGVWGVRLLEMMDVARTARVVEYSGAFEPVALVAEDYAPLRWVLSPETTTITQGDGEVAAVITGTAENLVRMLSREENLGVLLRAGRIRHVAADGSDDPYAAIRLLNEVIEMVRLHADGAQVQHAG